VRAGQRRALALAGRDTDSGPGDLLVTRARRGWLASFQHSVRTVQAQIANVAEWLGKFDTTMIWCDKQGLDCQETHERSSPGPAPAT